MIRIFYPHELSNNIEITSNKSHKISSVIRMKKGEEINIFDGNGSSQVMKIEEICKDKINLIKVGSTLTKDKEAPEIILAVSIIKPSRFEIAVEKTAELGVSKIIPLITQYTNDIFVKRFNTNRLDRMQNIAISASEQCGNDFVSEIESPKSLEDILRLKNDDTEIIMFYENLATIKNYEYDPKKSSKIIILIGPEGGFSDEEYKILEKNSIVLSLGENILRTETAAICSVHEIKSLIRLIP